jgi:hypothetical protein
LDYWGATKARRAFDGCHEWDGPAPRKSAKHKGSTLATAIPGTAGFAQPDPLFLIADWLCARYPFDNLADQLHVSPDRLEAMLGSLLPEPDPAPISEPTLACSEAENQLQRQIFKALLAEQRDPDVRVDWGADRAAHGGVTLPAISSQIGKRVDGRSLHLRPPAADHPIRAQIDADCAARRLRSRQSSWLHNEIRRLADLGHGKDQIMLLLQVSSITVWRAIRGRR